MGRSKWSKCSWLIFLCIRMATKKKAPWMGIVKNIPVHGALVMKTKYFLLINATYLFTVYLQLFQWGCESILQTIEKLDSCLVVIRIWQREEWFSKVGLVTWKLLYFLKMKSWYKTFSICIFFLVEKKILQSRAWFFSNGKTQRQWCQVEHE